MKELFNTRTSSVLFIGLLLFFTSCSKGVKMNEPVTTKKGLQITITGVSEKKTIGTPDDKSNYAEAKSGNLFVVVEYVVSNPTSADVEEVATAGLVAPDKKIPDENMAAGMAYERTNDKYRDNCKPENGRMYKAGKSQKASCVYEIAESDWKTAGWKVRVMGDKGFQAMGAVKE